MYGVEGEVWAGIGTGAGARRGLSWPFALLAATPLAPIFVGALLLATSAPIAPPASVMVPFGASALVSLPPATLVKTPPSHLLTAPTGFQVAVVQQATTIRTAPNGAEIAPQPTQTPFGSPVTYLVRQVQNGWLGVVSPLAGNGKLGWIPASSATLGAVNWELKLSLAARQLTVLHGTTVVDRFEIAIGRPSAPTPTGTFAVTDKLSTGDPAGPYGCCILALSALAPHAIQDWSGGDRIAIHSTPPDTYWSIGDAISHGCIHVTEPQGQWLMDHIPLGTPTIIRSD